MSQKYTIYFNEKALVFNIEPENFDIQSIPTSEQVQHFHNEWQSLVNNSDEHILIEINNFPINAAIEELTKKYTRIQAGGGYVENNQNEILFIYRLKKWDLPKGKIDSNESSIDAAIREVEEETHVKASVSDKTPFKTYHIYYEKKIPAWVLKETFWYKMKSDFSGMLIPQENENITDVKWVKENELKQLLLNTYPSIKDVCNWFGKN